MECRDGIKLISRVWQPAGQGPWPVLLMRQPYGRAIASTVTYAHPSWYAAHGFLVVVQDVRGQGASQGTFQGFEQELSDGADTIRWVRKLDGSNGRVGCYGFSYQGLTQLLSDDPAAIPDCLAPAMTGLDERSDWACEGGAHWWALGLGWGLQLAAQHCKRTGNKDGWQEIRRSLDSSNFLHDGLSLLQRHNPSGMACRWLSYQAEPGAPWINHQPQATIFKKPMLLIGGWYDPHLRGILKIWRLARAGGGNPLLRIGAWSHLDWRGGIDQLQLAFFNQHLQDKPGITDLLDLVLLQDVDSGDWKPACPKHHKISWGLISGGLAAIDIEEGQLHLSQPGEGGVVLVHDPWRPVPGRGGHLGIDAGPCERTDIDRRADVACFTTAPLDAPISLEGQPMLEIQIEADQPSFDLCAALSRIDGSGGVHQLSTGVARLRQQAGITTTVLLELQPLFANLEGGDRLRLSLAGSAWPQIAVNPGDSSIPSGPSSCLHRVITLKIDLAAAELHLMQLLQEDL